jgi:hypothetical protein
MRIQYTEFVANPALRNTIANLPAHVAQVLIAQGSAVALPRAARGSAAWLAERLEESAAFNPPAAAPLLTWGVSVGQVARRPAIHATCSNANCAMKFRFDGPPKSDAKNIGADRVVFTHSCGPHAPENVPSVILDKYTAAYGTGTFEYTSDEANMISFAASKGDSGKHRDVVHGTPIPGLEKLAYEV